MQILQRVRDRRIWVAVGTGAILVAALAVWAVHSYRRAQARDTLNTFAAFQSPALEIQFPRIVLDNVESRETLAAGLQNGVWTLHERGSKPPSVELRLTDQGQRWFSVVGNQIVATFKAGRRQATEVVELMDTFPSRQIRFRYVWTELHPASVVLGENLPTVGHQYDGEAVLFYQNSHWRLMQWNTPEFDQAVAHFQGLESGQN